jgi:RNA polymerase-interacting CarD/CdnL/TRCF family regulator
MIKAGDYVVHSMEGVCEVKAIVEMPKGKERVRYYQLCSWPEGKTTVYVPVKVDPERGARIREVLSLDEVRDLYTYLIDSDTSWISDISARQEWMSNIMRVGNPKEMACMTKMLMKKDMEKPLGSRDKAALLTAQKVLFSEIALVTHQNYRTILSGIKQNLRCPETPQHLF